MRRWCREKEEEEEEEVAPWKKIFEAKKKIFLKVATGPWRDICIGRVKNIYTFRLLAISLKARLCRFDATY